MRELAEEMRRLKRRAHREDSEIEACARELIQHAAEVEASVKPAAGR
jgi:hypothetical protein